jgi:transposase
MLLSEGQMSDHTGAKLLYPSLPTANLLIADKGYDSDEFREALAARDIAACIPPRRNRNVLHIYDKAIYKTRYKIENMFGKLKDWRRIATRYDRCAHIFFSAICIAASFIFYSINES